MKTLLTLLFATFIWQCAAEGGKNDERNISKQLTELKKVIDAQKETIDRLSSQVAAQTSVIQQLATQDPGDIIVENDGVLTCTWEVPE
jgi:hypothetical protein